MRPAHAQSRTLIMSNRKRTWDYIIYCRDTPLFFIVMYVSSSCSFSIFIIIYSLSTPPTAYCPTQNSDNYRPPPPVCSMHGRRGGTSGKGDGKGSSGESSGSGECGVAAAKTGGSEKGVMARNKLTRQFLKRGNGRTNGLTFVKRCEDEHLEKKKESK